MTRVTLLAEEGFLESLYNPSFQIVVQSWRKLSDVDDFVQLN